MKVTANQVTIARIILLPVPCGIIIYGDRAYLMAAFFLGIILGATDALDGYLARKNGVTTLGTLLDPVADKIFLAAFLLPFAVMGFLPPWLLAGILVRELLITGLRTVTSLRGSELKTSMWGKLKTVVQMAGLGVFFLMAFQPRHVSLTFNVVGSGGFLIAWLVLFFRKRRQGQKPAFWLTGTLPIWLVVTALQAYVSEKAGWMVIFVLMLVLAWVSAIGYLREAFTILKERDHHGALLSRVFWSVAIGGLAVPLAVRFPVTTVPLLLLFGAEIGLGGVDNIVAAEHKRGARASFAFIGAVATLFFLGASFLSESLPTVAVLAGAIVVAAVSNIQLGIAYARDREVFIDA